MSEEKTYSYGRQQIDEDDIQAVVEVLRGEPADGPPTHREALDDARQVWVLRDGHRV